MKRRKSRELDNELKPILPLNVNLWYVGIIGSLCIFFMLFYSIIIIFGEPLNTLNNGYQIEIYVKGNNLTLPIPNVESNLNYQFGSEKFFRDNFNVPPKEFHKFIVNNYIYDLETYNCKYWSYVWTLYYVENYKKYNWKFKYITTDNHIFTMIYNESGYMIGDEKNLQCYGKMGC